MNTKYNREKFPVMVVEDNPIARKYLARKLENAGYQVTCADDGKKALELFDRHFYPIVLTDWMMPEMNGLELCQAIRNRKNEGYVFIILLTARDSKEDIIAGLEAGADDYLVKPGNHAELIARLHSGERILDLEKNLKDANEEIKRLSITDPLTGCFNRGYMSKKLEQEFKRGRRYQHPLSLIFCDIDHFKRINDTFGHQAGDEILKEFSHCLMDNIRIDLDWLTRYGGEEFLIVLPETEPEGAWKVAERIREVVAEKEIFWHHERVPITASFGVTGIDRSYNGNELSPEILIRSADDALYQSKHEGRNRVSIKRID